MEFRQVAKFMVGQVHFFKIGVTSDLEDLAFQRETYEFDFVLCRALSVLVTAVGLCFGAFAGCSPAGLYLISSVAELRIGKFQGFQIKEEDSKPCMPAGVVERRSFYFLHMIMTAGDRGKTWPDGVTYRYHIAYGRALSARAEGYGHPRHVDRGQKTQLTVLASRRGRATSNHARGNPRWRLKDPYPLALCPARLCHNVSCFRFARQDGDQVSCCAQKKLFRIAKIWKNKTYSKHKTAAAKTYLELRRLVLDLYLQDRFKLS